MLTVVPHAEYVISIIRSINENCFILFIAVNNKNVNKLFWLFAAKILMIGIS